MLTFGFCGTFYGQVIKNPLENESFPGRACCHPVPLKVEVLALFQCDCILLTAPENSTGSGGETGTKIFTCFPSLIHEYICRQIESDTINFFNSCWGTFYNDTLKKS